MSLCPHRAYLGLPPLLENVKIEGNVLTFSLSGIIPALANSLRRTMLAEVPTLAIHEVMFFENDSPMHDEIIAHRLGLIPLITPMGRYVPKDECDCGSELGCPKCRVSLYLDVTASDYPRVVYSGDLRSRDDPEVRPVSNSIPITKLPPHGKLRLEAYARLGYGREHAKWQPVGTAIYKFQPIICIKEHCNACGVCVKNCPKSVLGISNNHLEIIDLEACSLCEFCMEVCPLDPPAISISHDRSKALFRVESTGSLPPKEILVEAIRILKEKSSKLLEEIEVSTIEKKGE